MTEADKHRKIELFGQLSRLQSRLELGDTEFKDMLGEFAEQVSVPVEVFRLCKKLGPLEAIIKYLREERQLRFVTIAKLINRDQRVVAVSYKNAARKHPARTAVKRTTYSLPITLLSETKLTAAEHIVNYLKENCKLSFAEIAVMTGRDQRTVWTLHSRSKKKLS